MKFPLPDILCLIIGWVFSGFLLLLFDKFVAKHNIGLACLLKRLPNTLGGILMVPFFILLAIPFVSMFSWCKIAYDYYIANDIINALLTFLVNTIGCFYTSFVLKDIPKFKRR